VTRSVEKPWGGEEIFAETDRYVGKILTIRAGHALSLQYHVAKDETMRVLSGSCELHWGQTPGDRELIAVILAPGSTVRIPAGLVHRLVALTDVRIIEVSTPEIDDVVRLEDRYGREGTTEP
jgi:mannose-6-phosphate isomerase-like protein (cupin superfamily)